LANDGRRTKATNEGAHVLVARFLGNYTEGEGLAEDIGYAYLRMAPLDVIGPLLARRPWSSEQVAQMLRAILKREDVTFSQDVLRDNQQFNLVTEWQWATRVRNDLAHSRMQLIDRAGYRGPNPDEETAARYPDLWELWPRTKRHSLQELPQRFDVEFLMKQILRIGGLLTALVELSAHLAIVNYNGYIGPGPKPHTPDRSA
jgi:hypothetical protein